jgi:hypothetical protein
MYPTTGISLYLCVSHSIDKHKYYWASKNTNVFTVSEESVSCVSAYNHQTENLDINAIYHPAYEYQNIIIVLF